MKLNFTILDSGTMETAIEVSDGFNSREYSFDLTDADYTDEERFELAEELAERAWESDEEDHYNLEFFYRTGHRID